MYCDDSRPRYGGTRTAFILPRPGHPCHLSPPGGRTRPAQSSEAPVGSRTAATRQSRSALSAVGSSHISCSLQGGCNVVHILRRITAVLALITMLGFASAAFAADA